MWLKQSTAVVVSFGPFVDKGDGVTPETGLVSAIDHGSTGILLSKNGGTLTIRHASVTASTYDAYGNYKVTLDTTDTGTLGTLRMQFIETATCLPVWMDFEVVPANVWDSIFGSDRLQVDVREENISLISKVDTIDDFLDTEIAAILAAVDTEVATIVTATTASAIRAAIGLASANLDTQLTAIDDYIDSEIATIVSQTTAAAIRAAVGLASANLDTQLGTIDDFLDTEVAAILAAVDTEVAAIVAATTASAIRAAVGLASANLDTQLSTIDDFLDTEIAAILAAVDTEVATIVAATTAAAIRSAIGLASANLDTQLSTIDDFLDTEVAAILAAVDTEISAIISSLAALFTTALTQSYRATGAAPTMAQAIFEIIAHLGNSFINGDVKELTNLAGATVKTFQLDSDTAPTAIEELT